MTLEELYNKVMSDRDNMAEFVKASGTGSLEDLAKQYGCSATDSEIRNFFISKCQGEGELDDDAVEAVSGGAFDFGKWLSDLFDSIFGGGSSTTQTAGSTGSIKSSSILGGGIVSANNDLPKSSIVGKGIAPAASNLQKSSIYKKL